MRALTPEDQKVLGEIREHHKKRRATGIGRGKTCPTCGTSRDDLQHDRASVGFLLGLVETMARGAT